DLGTLRHQSVPKLHETPTGIALSKGPGTGFPSAYANHLGKGRHKHLAVSNLAGLRGLDNGVDHRLGLVIRHSDLNFYLGHKIDGVFGSAISFGMPLLATE